ncbi:hypothetical protein BH11CYA1_BH11CYA1_44600 [soil metagenome]
MEKSLTDKIVSNINPVDFAQGFYQGAIEKPVNAVRQLVGLPDSSSDSKSNKKTVKDEKPETRTLASEAGNMAGQIVDLSLLALASHGALKPHMKESINGVAGSASKMFLAGALDGGLLTSSSSDKSLLEGRLEGALVSGTTFAVMGGAGKALEGVSLFPKSDFLAKSLNSALAGGAGGITSAYGHAFIEEHRLATGAEVLSAAGQYAAFGAGFHAFNAGAIKVAKLPAVESAYYRTKWNLEESAVAGKKLYFSTLADLNLQHPLKRVQDFVAPVKLTELPKVTLTAENNPVALFEREFPQYIKKIEDLEIKYEATPRGAERHQVFTQIGEEQTLFAEKLLAILHGTETKPGLNSYSNAELAQGHSIERVAAIRETLNSSLKRPNYQDASPFEEGMSKLVGRDMAGEDGFGILTGLHKAREKFFNYDERSLTNKLSLSSEHHAKARAYGTPIDWMPFEATDKLTNLFHATGSRALDSIFTEGKLLSARELRLRGIKQTSGESADEQFGRKAISMTRNFSEAFAYHRHGHETLADFPVVFGISRDVVTSGKGWNAGMLEPGELLSNRLNLGIGIFEKLGIRKPDITHIFVPDVQVPVVSRALASHRISGLRVIGFNDMDTPQWLQVSQ